MTRIFTLVIIAISIIAISAVTVGAPLSAQTDTTFTYQGELKQNGTPANGLFNIDFALWDAVSAGNQIDSTIELREVPVVEGKFTVELDFEANAFNNNDRWLEITVDGNTLSPRTPITRAPYSIQTRGIFVNDAGDVGIGTTMPEYPLEVHSSGTTGQILRLASDQSYGYVELSENSTARALLGFGDPGDLLDNAIPNSFVINGLSTAIHLAVDNDANKGITIDTNGDVGIGTAMPEYPLEIRNNDFTGKILRLVSDQPLGYVQFREGSTTRATLGFGDESDLLVNAIPDSFAINGLSTAIHLAVDSDANRGITIDTNGDVGIGTAIPEYPLHVESGNPGSVIYANSNRPDGTTWGVFGTCDSEDGTGVQGFATSSDGSSRGVAGQSWSINGIGVAGVAGNLSGVSYGVYGRSFSSAGYDFYAAGAGQDYGSSSSRRWKSNIVAIDNPLDKISQLQGVYFDWDKAHGGHHDVGMIAEEVGEVLPEIVQYEENGIDAIGLDYSKMTPLLVEAVKSLREEKDAEIAALRAQNADLTDRLGELDSLVKQLMTSIQQQGFRHAVIAVETIWRAQ